MMTVEELMQKKDEPQAYSVSPETTVLEALKLMSEKNIGAVMVVENDQMVGIFSERDFARKIVLTSRCTLESQVKDVMTRQMVIVHPEQSIEDCMTLMKEWHIRHLPVMKDGKLTGMVSMRDVVDAIIVKKDSTIYSLENYILGSDYGK